MSQIGWILFSLNSAGIFPTSNSSYWVYSSFVKCSVWCIFVWFVSVLCLVLNFPCVFWFFILDVPHRYSLMFIPLADNPSEQHFCGIRVAQSVVFCVMFCRSLFVPLSFFFWPLYCLFSWLPTFNYPIFKLVLLHFFFGSFHF